jgi:hypothetical protein
MASPTASTASTADVLAAVARVSKELEGLVSLLVSVRASPETVVAVESAGRLMDAARVWAAAPLDRSAAEKLGFASPTAAVAALAQISERTARQRLALAEGIAPDVSVSGSPLPPRHGEVALAFTAGGIGLEAAVLITREVDGFAHRVEPEARSVVEGVMVNLACGLDPTGQQQMPPQPVDKLTEDVRMLGAAVDPDGARPREERAARNRAVWIGKPNDDGLMPLGGLLDPVLGTLLLRLIEAWRRSPRFTSLDDPAAADSRTPDQRRHDAFGEVLIAAAAAEGAPEINGHPVAVMVTVGANDLARPDGLDSDPIGVLAGSPFPMSRRRVEQLIDANGFRKVALSEQGAVTGISSPERCFTGTQILAIAARDGYRCSTPGCTTPHTALQAHHVIPWRDRGPTSTSNGILLCYWHHQRVDDGPWRYRMVDGVPEVCGPGIPEWRRIRPDRAQAA